MNTKMTSIGPIAISGAGRIFRRARNHPFRHCTALDGKESYSQSSFHNVYVFQKASLCIVAAQNHDFELVRTSVDRRTNSTYSFQKRSQSTHKALATDGDDIHRYRYKLYQYKICPFSNIAKVFLTYQRIPFESVEVNPLTKAELEFSENYRKVPIVTVLDTDPYTPAAEAVQQLNGTEEILLHHHPNANSDNGDDQTSGDSSTRWQNFARTKLAPLLYPNICSSLGDSFRAFGYVHSNPNSFSTVQRFSIQCIGSVAMYFAASKIKEKYKIDDVKVALDDALEELESELTNEGKKFLRSPPTGPDLGDLAVFGVLKGLEGLPLWNTIFDNDDLQPRFPNLRKWYANVDEVVESRKSQTPRYGYND